MFRVRVDILTPIRIFQWWFWILHQLSQSVSGDAQPHGIRHRTVISTPHAVHYRWGCFAPLGLVFMILYGCNRR
ncbi:hypothetical protein F4677DRAFT_436557 [Hypoxylon crocopeplum]|nr:hypothetical protein F4677DRAFT_436557 [Hypoxylon crocopeplum]